MDALRTTEIVIVGQRSGSARLVVKPKRYLRLDRSSEVVVPGCSVGGTALIQTDIHFGTRLGRGTIYDVAYRIFKFIF